MSVDIVSHVAFHRCIIDYMLLTQLFYTKVDPSSVRASARTSRFL